MAKGKKPTARLVRTGFAKDQGKWSIETQMKILLASGIKEDRIVIDDLQMALDMLRGKEVLETAGGFRALGSGRYTISGEVAKIKEAGKVLKDCQTKQRSDRDGFEMLSHALAAIHGELTAPNPDDAREWGERGAKKRWAKRQEERMPEDQALAIWTDQKLSLKQSIRRMKGWTVRTAHEVFGASGKRTGAAAHRKRKTKRKKS